MPQVMPISMDINVINNQNQPNVLYPVFRQIHIELRKSNCQPQINNLWLMTSFSSTYDLVDSVESSPAPPQATNRRRFTKKTVQKWQNIPTLMGIQLNHAKLHLKTQKSAGSNAKKGQTSPATS